MEIPALLTNAESWTLMKSDEKVCERIEIGALKSVLELPKSILSPALIYAMGTLYTTLRINKKQLLYFCQILCRDDQHWTKHMLMVLNKLGTGLSKHVKLKPNEYGMEQVLQTIKDKSKRQWQNEVTSAVEAKQKE